MVENSEDNIGPWIALDKIKKVAIFSSVSNENTYT
jgi:hypothetical protein